MSKNVIPVLMAADEHYMRYLWVAILSMLMNKKETTCYDFYILSPRPYPRKVLKAYNELKEKYIGTKFNFVKVGNLFEDALHIGQLLPAPTYYYLKIADIITKYDKAIYLDPDIIVLKDLSELFNTNLGDNYVAGVKAAGYVQDLEYARAINMKDISQYINANSLVFNLKEIRQTNLTEKFINYSQKLYPSMDQDVLNVVCLNKIIHLPFKYNVMTKYLPISGNKKYSAALLQKVYGEAYLQEADKSPVIIHYANVGEKPWNTRLPKDQYWWHYAFKSPWKCLFVLSFIKSRLAAYCRSLFRLCFSIEKKYTENKKIKIYTIFGIHFTNTKERSN